MPSGYLSLILHAHLPFVRHPEHEDFLEEDWLFEAITECYLPLLACFERLKKDKVPFQLTLNLSPTLCAMLRDDLLQRRYIQHLENLIALTEKEVKRTAGDPVFAPLAGMYHELFVDSLDRFTGKYDRDLTAVFGQWERDGCIEIMTCGATHGFLPLLRTEPESVRAQVEVGQQSHRETFGVPARGIWLPECGFYPGLETVLKDAGLRYFVVDAHGVLNADVRAHYGLFAPVACSNGMAAFPRDLESSRQVWSATEGYPGDSVYRDFYRDVGFDLDFEYIAPHVLDHSTRVFTGVKYYRITGGEGEKEPYDPAAAAERVRVHAEHFLSERGKQIEEVASRMDRPPLIVCPYDAELFGHWWFEGPRFIEALFRCAQASHPELETVTPSGYLEEYPVLQQAIPSLSSWGSEGYNDHWLSGDNDWVYPHLHRAAQEMCSLADQHAEAEAGSLLHRALTQAARSLLLAQASDWPFILRTGTSVEYAKKRIEDHLARFIFLRNAIRADEVDVEILSALEEMDNLFPFLDFRVFGTCEKA